MTPDELAAKRAEHIAQFQAIRQVLIPMLLSGDEKTRRAAAPRLRRVDQRIRELGGIPGEQDEGDELITDLMAPGSRRYLLL